MRCYCHWVSNYYRNICFALNKLTLIKSYHLRMCIKILLCTMIWTDAAVKSSCKWNNFWKGFEISSMAVVKLVCKRNDFSKRFEISNWFEFTSVQISCKCSLRYSLQGECFISIMIFYESAAFLIFKWSSAVSRRLRPFGDDIR